MTFGVILAAHNAQPNLAATLAPWLSVHFSPPAGHKFVLCAVCMPFEGFPQGPADDTLHQLRLLHAPRRIDHLISGNVPMKETEARGQALRWLADAGVEAVWQCDLSDEFYTVEQIRAIADFFAARSQVAWARICLRNYVFDTRTYLVEPFTPPRIHRVNVGGYQARSFCDDNDVAYYGTITRDILPASHFASVTVPKSVAWIPHWSWLNDLRSKAKQQYQWTRWNRCSFKWDDAQGGLIWADPSRAPETATDP